MVIDLISPLKNVSLAELFTSSRKNGNDEDDEGALHARTQVRGYSVGRRLPEHLGGGTGTGCGRLGSVQLGEGQARWQARRCGWQARERRENGDCTFARRARARDGGARHLGKSDGVLSKGIDLKYALSSASASVSHLGAMRGAAGQRGGLPRALSSASKRCPAKAPRRRRAAGAHQGHPRRMRGGYGLPRIWRELLACGIRVGKGGAKAQATAWHPRQGQVPLQAYHRQQAQLADLAQPAGSALQRPRVRNLRSDAGRPGCGARCGKAAQGETIAQI
jgi:hypothetical protein